MRRTQPVSVLLVSALLGGLLIEAGPASAQLNGKIAFAAVDNDDGGATLNFEVYSIDPDGSDPVDLTKAKDAIDVDPAWTPDGTQVAFARKGPSSRVFEMFTMDAGGTNKSKITTGTGGASDRQPAWTPAGTQIALTRSIRSADTSHVYVMNADGTGQVQLTESPAGGYDSSPAWRPDGSQVAFISDRDGGLPEIYVMDPAGFTETRLTFNSDIDGNPAYSPDGLKLAFERQTPGGTSDIWVRDLLTSAETNLTNTTDASEHQPAWSPEGDQIVYTRYPAGGGDKNLWTMDADGTNQLQLPAGMTGRIEMAPHWGTAPETLAAPAQKAASATQLGDAEPQASSSLIDKPNKKKQKSSRKVIKGVRFTQLRRFKSDVYVLKVDPHLKPRIDVALSNDKLPGHERTSRMAKRHDAVAAINGDFGLPSGRPSHTFAEDGDLKQISFATAPNFALSSDELTAYFDRPFETVTVDEADSADLWRIDRWNFGEPAFNDVSAFTAAGGTLETPPGNACSARLLPTTGRRWAPGLSAVEQDFQVNQVACATKPMPLNGGIVLSAQPTSDGAILIGSLTAGELVTLTWSLGWTSVLDTIGGTPLIVDDGAVAVQSCSGSICAKHPRTGIGVTALGKVLMVVVDGRRKGSAGVTLKKFGKLMRDLHAVNALNLDGGGSSTMVVEGDVVNVPSDGKQRKVSSAALVLKGADTGEVIGPPLAKLASQAVVPAPASEGAGMEALLDPASTGGLLEALARGTFGRPLDLPPGLRRALRTFRASQQAS